MSPEAELWAYVALEAKADGPQGRSIDARFRVTPPIGANSEKSWEIKAAENRPAKIFLKVPFDLKNAAFREIPEKEYAAAFVLDGRKVLPMEPETHRILKDSKYRSGGCYGLIASCMLESEFLPAADARAAMVMDFMENRGGLRLGMSEFDGGIDHAYTYGYWLDSLKLDRVKPVILGFYGSLAYGMSRETFSGVEVTHHVTGDNESTLPHLYSCTQQLRLLRMMLLREDGDDLWIGQAVPRPWLKAANRIEVSGAPTKFGPVSFSYESRAEKGEILAEVTAPARRSPRNMMIRFRHPDGKPIRAVEVNGSAVTTFSGETLSLSTPRGAFKIRVSFAK